jgi:predicted transcriptional regulator of viral defense system
MRATVSGIEAGNRELLAKLNRAVTGPFTVEQGVDILRLPVKRVRRLLAYLAERGWLARVQRGLYTTVPLGAVNPHDWREDPWIIATRAFSPCYIGGLSACEHWALTEQLFRTVIVYSTHRLRTSKVERQGTSFWIKTIGRDHMFGTRRLWRGAVPVDVSDPSRTIIDVCDSPRFGGGIRHVAQVLREYFTSDMRNDKDLLNYAKLIGSGAVYKRLGYLLEAMNIEAPAVVAECRSKITSGLARLDPSVASGGRILKRWNIRVNATMEPNEDR